MHDNNERLSSTVKMYSKESPNCSCFPLDGASSQECISHACRYLTAYYYADTHNLLVCLKKAGNSFCIHEASWNEDKIEATKRKKRGEGGREKRVWKRKNSWNNFRNLPNWLQLFSGGGGEEEMAISPS